MTLNEFVEKHRLVMTVTPEAGGESCACAIGLEGLAPGICVNMEAAPRSLPDALDIIAGECREVENAGDFNEWECGYDGPDAKGAYATVTALRDDLKAMLGDDAFGTLLWFITPPPVTTDSRT
jgi:hypothetical protein